MALFEDAQRAEEERVRALAAEEAETLAAARRIEQTPAHPKLVELAQLLKNRSVPTLQSWQAKGEPRHRGRRLAYRYERSARGWAIEGAWGNGLFIDEEGHAWMTGSQYRHTAWDGYFGDLHLGLPRSGWHTIKRSRRILNDEEAEDFAMRGATGAIAGRIRDGVILKTPEEAAREAQITRDNR